MCSFKSLHSSILVSPSTHQSTPNATEVPLSGSGELRDGGGSDLAFHGLQAWCAEGRLTGRQPMINAGVP